MSNDTRTDKAIELLKRLINQHLFIQDIKEIRDTFGIPENGFLGNESMTWLENRVLGEMAHLTGNKPDLTHHKSMQLYEDAFDFLLQKYKLPPIMRNVLEPYLLMGNLPETRPSDFAAVIDEPFFDNTPMSLDAQWKRAARPYVRLLIHSEATPTDVSEFIHRNWSKIARTLKQKRLTKTNRIRKRTKAERDRRIAELRKMYKDQLRAFVPKDELHDRFRQAKLSKNQMIMYIIQQEFPGEEINSDIIYAVTKTQRRREKMDF